MIKETGNCLFYHFNEILKTIAIAVTKAPFADVPEL